MSQSYVLYSKSRSIQIGKEVACQYGVFQGNTSIQTDLCDADLELLELYLASNKDVSIGRGILELSRMEAIMEVLRPLDEKWWRCCVVDRGVTTGRKERLRRLGYHVRSQPLPPPYMYLIQQPHYIEGGWNLLYDPAWNTVVPTKISTGNAMRYVFSDWTSSISTEALEIEWVNIMYGILETAWMYRVTYCEGPPRDCIPYPSTQATFSIGMANINWDDVYLYLPTIATHSGLGIPYYAADGNSISLKATTMVAKMKAMERSMDNVNPIVSLLSSEMGRYSHLNLNDYISCTRIRTGYHLSDPGISLYEPILLGKSKSVTRENVRDTVIWMGLVPLTGIALEENDMISHREWTTLEGRWSEPYLLALESHGLLRQSTPSKYEIGYHRLLKYSEYVSRLERMKEGESMLIDLQHIPLVVHLEMTKAGKKEAIVESLLQLLSLSGLRSLSRILSTYAELYDDEIARYYLSKLVE
jgi:hypothetical protein